MIFVTANWPDNACAAEPRQSEECSALCDMKHCAYDHYCTCFACYKMNWCVSSCNFVTCASGMCCSCGMCYDNLSRDHNFTSLESHTALNMSHNCGDTCVNSGGFCYAGTCYSPDECNGKCDVDCETCFCGTCLGSSTRDSGSIAEPSYFVDATLASGGLAAVCLLGVLGRWSLKTIKNRQYEKLDSSTEKVRASPVDLCQDEMCYQNFKISPYLNVSQIYF